MSRRFDMTQVLDKLLQFTHYERAPAGAVFITKPVTGFVGRLFDSNRR